LNQTKIIATVGPASGSVDMLEKLIRAGVDVFRLNFSHGELHQHAATVENIRTAARILGECVAIMGDLSGPKIRLGHVSGGPRHIADGQIVRFTRESDPGTGDLLGTNYAPFIDEVLPGHRVLIDDGNVRLSAQAREGDHLVCLCAAGGDVSNHKGVNLPDTKLSLPSLTEKDVRDLEWAVAHDLDYLALSFVRGPEDLHALRARLDALGSDIPIVAKIEKPEAVTRSAEIIHACDVVLVARGDLGVEMDVARVPLIQKDLVRQCTYAGRPVIVATQMLQSMVECSTPTRAEVSDVANAILDAADAVMLSAETAVGKYPVRAVETIHRIASETEPMLNRLAPTANREVLAAAMRVTSGVARGAALLARDLSSRVVAVWTRVGNTPRILSKHRLSMPVVGLSPDERICRRLAMFYGVVPIRLDLRGEEGDMLDRLDHCLIERKLVHPGDLAIVIMGTELTQPGSTNTLLIHLVGQEHTPNTKDA
jgi:pyruvate kinase